MDIEKDERVQPEENFSRNVAGWASLREHEGSLLSLFLANEPFLADSTSLTTSGRCAIPHSGQGSS